MTPAYGPSSFSAEGLPGSMAPWPSELHDLDRVLKILTHRFKD